MNFINVVKNLCIPAFLESYTVTGDGAIAMFVLNRPDSVVETIELYYQTKIVQSGVDVSWCFDSLPTLEYTFRLKSDTTEGEHVQLIDALCAPFTSTKGKHFTLCEPHEPEIIDNDVRIQIEGINWCTMFRGRYVLENRPTRQVDDDISNVEPEDIKEIMMVLLDAISIK